MLDLNISMEKKVAVLVRNAAAQKLLQSGHGGRRKKKGINYYDDWQYDHHGGQENQQAQYLHIYIPAEKLFQAANRRFAPHQPFDRHTKPEAARGVRAFLKGGILSIDRGAEGL